MAFVALSKDGARVTGVFARPQPDVRGFVEVPDNDPRLIYFLNPPPMEWDYVMSLTGYLNQRASERHYFDALSAASFTNDVDPQISTEASAFRTWYQQVWHQFRMMRDAVAAGTLPPPSVADFLASLPPFFWPEWT